MSMRYGVKLSSVLYKGAGMRLKVVVVEKDGCEQRTVGWAEKSFKWEEVRMDALAMSAWVLEEVRRIVRERQEFVEKREAIEQRLEQAIERSEFELLGVDIEEVY